MAFQVDQPGTTFSIEQNSIEGIHGVSDQRTIELKTPKGAERLPERKK